MPPVRKKLGDILLEMGALDAHQLKAALGHQQQWGMPLGQALLERQLCTPSQVLQALGVQTGLEVVELEGVELPASLTTALPLKVAQMARAVPLEVKGARNEVLVVAVAAPASLEVLDLVRSGSGKLRIVPKLAADDAIERAIGRLYLGIVPEPKKAPPAPAPVPEHAMLHPTEQLLELDASEAEATPAPAPTAATATAAAPARTAPVLLLGWSEEVGAALGAALRKAGVEARAIAEDEALGCREEDVLVTSTLALNMLLGPGERLRGRVIVCGMPESGDMAEARALGARLYLPPPFTSEQLLDAIHRATTPSPAARGKG